MSNKRKQTQKNNTTKTAEEKSTVTVNNSLSDNKDTTANKANKVENKVEKKIEKPTDTKSTNQPQQMSEKTAAKEEKKAAPQNQVKEKTQDKQKISAKVPEKKAENTTPSKTTPPSRSARFEESKKKGSLGTALALLLGIAGTGLGAYSFNGLRALKANMGGGSEIEVQLTGLTDKVSGLEKTANIAELKQQISNLTKQHATIKEAEARVNERVSQIEQMQKGLSKSVATDIDTALKARMGAVNTLLTKVKDIELGQQGLSKNLTEVSSASQTVTAAGMERQEVGYLLRMANYKIQNEGDITAATGLLKMAESKLLAANEGKTDATIDTIREKLIQLSGVKVVDNDALIAELKTISKAIPQLTVKVNRPAQTADNTDKAKSKDESMLSQIGSVIASGVKYTPKDPSKIDISSETVLIEKRLMQADVKTAELAIQSHNKVLLAQSIQSVQDSLEKYFAKDNTATMISDKLTQLSQSQLETTLPDLSDLVKQFQSTQAQ